MPGGTTVGALNVKIIGDDIELSKTLKESAKKVAKWGAATAAAATAAAVAMTVQGLKSVDALAKQSRAMDASIQGYQALERAASRAGVSQEDLQSESRNLNRALGEAQKGASAAKEALDGIGLSADSLVKMDIDERFITIANRTKELGLNSAQTAKVLNDLGIGQASFVNLLKEGGGAIEESAQKLKDYGVTLSNIDAAKVEQANDAMGELAIVQKGLSMHMASQFAPVLEGISNTLIEQVKDWGGAEGAAKKMMNFVTKGAGYVGDAIRGIEIVIKGLEIGFRSMGVGAIFIFEKIIGALDTMTKFGTRAINDLIKGLNNIPGVDIELLNVENTFSRFQQVVKDYGTAAAKDLAMSYEEMAGILEKPLPSKALKDWVDEVTFASEQAAMKSENARKKATKETGGKGGMSKEERDALTEKLNALRESHMTETEAVKNKIAQDLAILDEGHKNGLVSYEEYKDQKQGIAQDGLNKLDDIEEKSVNAKIALAEKEKQAKMAVATGMLGNLASLMNTSSRKSFEVGKIAAIANASVSGAEAVMHSYKEGTKFGGPVLGAAFAATAAIAAANNINNIRKQTFGGGGGAPTPAGQGSSGVAAPVTQTAAPTQVANINLVGGDMFGKNQVIGLIEQINELSRDGVRLNIAGAT